MSEIFQQIEQAKKEAKDVETDKLPQGASPIEASAETAEVESEVTEDAATEATDTEAETLIRIGDREFKTQAEAIKYAESLEGEKTQLEAYNQGIRDALQTQGQPQAAPVEQEDDFEERFYKDPKGTLKEVQAKATQDALSIIKQEQARERQWDTFLNKYPDVRRKDAERILQENWDTIGKMTDVDKAMAAMANKVRAEYEEIVNLAKPRTELSSKKGQVVSRSGGSPGGVTQKNKSDEPVDFVSQVRRMKGNR